VTSISVAVVVVCITSASALSSCCATTSDWPTCVASADRPADTAFFSAAEGVTIVGLPPPPGSVPVSSPLPPHPVVPMATDTRRPNTYRTGRIVASLA
jgi:hypothetical protein